jgi:hypothetical protein
MESGTSPCLVRDAFTRDGVDYVVVDYIQVKWVSKVSEHAEDWDIPAYLAPEITNQNRKLRTFVVPAEARLSFFNGEDDAPEPTFGDLVGHVADGDANDSPWVSWGFWEIKVSNGQVVYLVGAEKPGDED